MTATRRQRLALYATSVSQAMILLDLTIVNVALPSIQHDLHLDSGDLEWVISAYALSLAALIPLGGTLGDRFGRKRIFLAGLVVFTLASAACALSGSAEALIACRVVQGIGGAVMSALTLSILSEAYPADSRARAIGIWSAIASLGFGLGPVVGGLLLARYSWSSVFWVNVPIGAVGVIVTLVGVTESKDPVPRRFDGFGALLSAVGLAGVTFGFVEAADRSFSSPVVLAPIAIGVVLLIGFVGWEYRTPSPMVPPALLRQGAFGTAVTVYFLVDLALASVMFFATLLFQDVRGWTALQTGLSWLAMNVPFMVAAQCSGTLHRRFTSTAVALAGCLLATAGVTGLSFFTVTTPVGVVLAGYAVMGLGYGLLMPAITNVAMSRVPVGASGVAAGVLNTSRQVGTSVGLGVVGFIGVSAATRAWVGSLTDLPVADRSTAEGLAHQVAGGGVSGAAAQLGSSARSLAVQAFAHGYQVAILSCAVALAAAAAVSALHLRAAHADRSNREASAAIS